MADTVETPVMRYQRHQRQVAAGLAAGAAVPALMALRSGRAASLALGEGNHVAQATHAGAQLKHAATATALGGLSGAANAVPTPKRLLSPRVKHKNASGKKPAKGLTNSGIGKKAPSMSPGFDEGAAREKFRAKEQIRAGRTQSRQSRGFGPKPDGAPHFNPSTAQRAASAAHREDQAVTRAARPFVRKPTAIPKLSSHIAGGQVRDAALAAAAVGGAGALLHYEHRKAQAGIAKMSDKQKQSAIGTTAGGVAGGGAARAGTVVGGQTLKAHLKVQRAKVGVSPVDEKVWGEHKAAHGVRNITSATPNKVKNSLYGSYPKALPGWKAQRALAFKNRPSVQVAAIGGAAIGGAALAHHMMDKPKKIGKRMNRDQSAGALGTAGTGLAIGGAGLLGASKQVKQNTVRTVLRHAKTGNVEGALGHGIKGLKTASGLERAGAAGIGAGALAAGVGGAALLRNRKPKSVAKRDDAMTDAFGVDRSDLAIAKAGKHVYDPDSPSSKAANKKHKGKFHPAFVAHIGAHSFDHSAKDEDTEPDKKSPEIKDDADSDNTGPRKFPPKKGHKPKKGVPAAFADFGKADGYSPNRSMRSQGLAFSGKEGRKTVNREARHNNRMILPGPNRKENWKTAGKHIGIGAGAGTALGGVAGAAVGGVKGAALGSAAGADLGANVGAATGYLKIAHRAGGQAIQHGIQSGNIKTGVPKSQTRPNGLPKKNFGKAYQPGTITYHQEQANLHARKKTAAGKRGEGFATAAGLGVAGGAAVHVAAPKIARAVAKPASEVGTLGHELQAAKLAPKIARGARIGGLGILGTGAALAGASAAQRVHHANKQNKHVKLAQAARTERNAGLKKSYTPPLPGLESSFGERTVDGMPETNHGGFIERLEPVEKSYYYGSAPAPKDHTGATASAAAFGGAATGAALGPQAKKIKAIKTVGPKLRAAKVAMKAV